MSEIKEKADEYKSANGNDKITQKDLLFYLISRLDDLEDKLEVYDKEVTKVKTQVRIFWILLPISLTVVGYVGSLL